MRDRLRSDLTRAMKARDQVRVMVLRSALAAIGNAEAVEVVATSEATIGSGDVRRKTLTGEQLVAVLHSEIQEREESVGEYERGEQHDRAEILRQEIEILRSYLAV